MTPSTEFTADRTHQSPTKLHSGLLEWRWPSPVSALSSAPVGGGFQAIEWLLNVGVPLTYNRVDLAGHSAEIAAERGLAGDGATLFTAANVADCHRQKVGGVTVDATVGISKPTWAADAAGGWSEWQPGTVNIVVQVQSALSPAAAVNAVATATEAKSQAFFEASVPGTGTASDAVVVTWPSHASAPAVSFAGPRSAVGTEIAVAVHAAVVAGITTWQDRLHHRRPGLSGHGQNGRTE